VGVALLGKTLFPILWLVGLGEEKVEKSENGNGVV
jgi:hypothetical protein